eukprot:360749-Chlamydomonas_euryale.AAC.1
MQPALRAMHRAPWTRTGDQFMHHVRVGGAPLEFCDCRRMRHGQRGARLLSSDSHCERHSDCNVWRHVPILVIVLPK